MFKSVNISQGVTWPSHWPVKIVHWTEYWILVNLPKCYENDNFLCFTLFNGNTWKRNVRNITSIWRKTVMETQMETRSNPRQHRDSPTLQTYASANRLLDLGAAVNCSRNNSVGGTWHVYLTAFAAVQSHLAVYFPLFTSRWTRRSHPSAVITDIDRRLKLGPLSELAGHYS